MAFVRLTMTAGPCDYEEGSHGMTEELYTQGEYGRKQEDKFEENKDTGLISVTRTTNNGREEVCGYTCKANKKCKNELSKYTCMMYPRQEYDQ